MKNSNIRLELKSLIVALKSDNFAYERLEYQNGKFALLEEYRHTYGQLADLAEAARRIEAAVSRLSFDLDEKEQLEAEANAPLDLRQHVGRKFVDCIGVVRTIITGTPHEDGWVTTKAEGEEDNLFYNPDGTCPSFDCYNFSHWYEEKQPKDADRVAIAEALRNAKPGDQFMLRNGETAIWNSCDPRWEFEHTLSLKNGGEIWVNSEGFVDVRKHLDIFDIVGIIPTEEQPAEASETKQPIKYAGLLDKNGVKIEAGNIVIATIYGLLEEKIRCVVDIEDGCMGIRALEDGNMVESKGKFKSFEDCNTVENIEVIEQSAHKPKEKTREEIAALLENAPDGTRVKLRNGGERTIYRNKGKSGDESGQYYWLTEGQISPHTFCKNGLYLKDSKENDLYDIIDILPAKEQPAPQSPPPAPVLPAGIPEGYELVCESTVENQPPTNFEAKVGDIFQTWRGEILKCITLDGKPALPVICRNDSYFVTFETFDKGGNCFIDCSSSDRNIRRIYRPSLKFRIENLKPGDKVKVVNGGVENEGVFLYFMLKRMEIQLYSSAIGYCIFPVSGITDITPARY